MKDRLYRYINQYYTLYVIYPIYPELMQRNHALGVIDEAGTKATMINFIASKRDDQGTLWTKIDALEGTDILDSFTLGQSDSDMITYAGTVFSGLTDEMKKAVAWSLQNVKVLGV